MSGATAPGGGVDGPRDGSFDREIDGAVRTERRLFFKALIALGIVVVVVVLRALFFA